MANMGCIDLHTWASRVDRPELPDWVMFDLDPSEDSNFEEVVEVAQLVKQTLDLLELASYPKTSGSRGIHVLVPITRRHSFEEARDFAGSSRARSHVRTPVSSTTEWAKQKRRGVLVDANQNGPGRRTRASTRCALVRVRRSPRRCAGTRSCRGSILWVHDGHRARPGRTRRRSLRGRARGKQSLRAALKSLR